MAYKKKDQKATRVGTKAALKLYLEGDLFTIEKTPPAPRRAMPEEQLAFTQKLDRTVAATPFEGAFIIPARGKGIALRHFKDNYPDLVFRTYVISDNKDMIRVYKYHNTQKVIPVRGERKLKK